MLKLYQFLFNTLVSIFRIKLKLKLNTIEVENYKISYLYRVATNQRTLIFIHGLNDEKDSWLKLISYLKKDYNIVAIDLLGCGDSNKPKKFDYSLKNQANFTSKIIKKIINLHNLKEISLIGHSMGGGIAIYMANNLPLNSLILLSPLAINVKEPYIQKLAKKLGKLEDIPFLNVCSKKKLYNLVDILYYKKPNIPTFVAEVIINKKCKLAKFEDCKIRALVNEDNMEFKDNLTNIAKEIVAKTLIVWGNNDKVLDVASGYELNKLIKKSTLKVYDCGHMLQLEEPRKLAYEINNFISK